MKKFLTALTALSLIATPAMAREHRSERRGGGCGWLCGAVIGGIIVGAIASAEKNSRDDRDRDDMDNRRYNDDTYYDDTYEYRTYQRQVRTCFNEQIVEIRHGRQYIYYVYRCH